MPKASECRALYGRLVLSSYSRAWLLCLGSTNTRPLTMGARAVSDGLRALALRLCAHMLPGQLQVRSTQRDGVLILGSTSRRVSVHVRRRARRSERSHDPKRCDVEAAQVWAGEESAAPLSYQNHSTGIYRSNGRHHSNVRPSQIHGRQTGLSSTTYKHALRRLFWLETYV